MPDRPPIVEIKKMYPPQEVAEHEVLLSFIGDSQAVMFHEWWNEFGEVDFLRYVEMGSSE